MGNKYDKNNIILEKDLDGKGMQNDESQEPFLAKAKEAVCRIRYNGTSGTGFFIDILGGIFLITNNHVYPQDSEIIGNFIDVTINGKTRTINLEGRQKWTNKEYGFHLYTNKKRR